MNIRSIRGWEKSQPSIPAVCRGPCLGAVVVAIILAALVASAPTARAQTYQADILYPLAVPPGLDDEILDRLYGHEIFAYAGKAVSYSRNSFGDNRALMWDDSGTAIDLQPVGGAPFTQSRAYGAYGTEQFGSGFNVFLGAERAVLWNGSAATFENWHPTNVTAFHSRIRASDGTQYVGAFAPSTGEERALLYNGSPSAAVSLHPSALSYVLESRGLAVAGGKQGGDALTTTGANHAFLWSGTAASAVDLHPTEFHNSTVFGMSATQQVGVGQLEDLTSHAVLWTGTAASAVDLHPDGLGIYAESRAAATNGTIQVGAALTLSEVAHAMMWSGSPKSAVNLQSLLPENFYTSSATSVDASGAIYGLAVTDDDVVHAVRWRLAGPSSPADFDGDGDVDADDLTAWRGGYGTSPGATQSQGDADGNGTVDGADFLAWQRALTTPASSPLAAAVPEPDAAGLALAALALFAMSVATPRKRTDTVDNGIPNTKHGASRQLSRDRSAPTMPY
jgi:hypothetical protein